MAHEFWRVEVGVEVGVSPCLLPHKRKRQGLTPKSVTQSV